MIQHSLTVPQSAAGKLRIEELADHVPDGLVLGGVDQTLRLAAQYTTACSSGRIQMIGSTRSGEPLTMCSLGTGPVHVLVLGGPHSNEPISGATVPQLLSVLATAFQAGDRRLAPFTFDVVAVWDLDGARLCSGATRPDLLGYHREFFRAAAADQPEWSFPVNGGDPVLLPETRAVMDVIDDIAPVAVVSLHNADIAQGAYLTSTGLPPNLAARLSLLPARFGIPLDRAPSDGADWPEPAPGVRVMPPTHRLDAACSLHYAARRGAAFGLITEAPQWYITPPPTPDLDTWTRQMDTLAGRARHALDPLVPTVEDLARTFPACQVGQAARFFLEHADEQITHALRDEPPVLPEARQVRWRAEWVKLHRIPLRVAGLVLTLARPHPCHHPLRERVRAHADDVLRAGVTALSEQAAPTPVPLHLAVKLQLATTLSLARSAQEVYA